ncbi:hypothetical protein AQAU111925_01200 [Aquirufa aurantiipilula]
MIHKNGKDQRNLSQLMRIRISKFLIRFSRNTWNQSRKSNNPKVQLTPDESKALWSRIQNTLHSY